MKELKMTIHGKEIVLKFNFKTLRILGDMWGCKGPVEVVKKFAGPAEEVFNLYLVSDKNKTGSVDIPFEFFDVFSDVVKAGLKSNGLEVEFEEEDYLSYLFSHPEKAQEMVSLFLQSLPVNTDEAGKQMKAAMNKVQSQA